MVTTVATSAPTLGAELRLGLRHGVLRKACSQASPVGVNSTQPRARIARIGLARDQAPGLALVHQVAHRLLAHAGALGQFGQARALAAPGGA